MTAGGVEWNFFCLPSPIRPDWEFRTTRVWGEGWDTQRSPSFYTVSRTPRFQWQNSGTNHSEGGRRAHHDEVTLRSRPFSKNFIIGGDDNASLL